MQFIFFVTTQGPSRFVFEPRKSFLEDGDILLHRFSPTGFYSSAVRNSFLRNLEERSHRQIAFTKEPLGDHAFELDVGIGTKKNYWVTKGDLQHAREWISTEVNRRLLNHFVNRFKANDKDVKDTMKKVVKKAVREAVYLLVTARRLGEEYDGTALTVLNDAARELPAVPRLTPAGRWTQATPGEALSMVARHAVELLGGPDVPLLKECGNPECTRAYIDRSRGTRRQWCGMESCGNKIKAAAYRARRKAAPAPAN